MREAVRQAEDAYQKTGKRHYVMPYGYSKKLVIMDRHNFRKLKQKGYITYKAFVRDLELECFYFTPYRDGRGAITPDARQKKREQYFRWYAACIGNSKKKGSDEVHDKG